MITDLSKRTDQIPIHVLFGGQPRIPLNLAAPPDTVSNPVFCQSGMDHNPEFAIKTRFAGEQTDGPSNGMATVYFGTNVNHQNTAIIFAQACQDHQGLQCEGNNCGEMNSIHATGVLNSGQESFLDGNAEFAAMMNCAPTEENHGTYAFTAGSNCNPVYCCTNANPNPAMVVMQ